MFKNLFDGPHLIIVLLVLVVLFGAKRLPDAARSLGRSMRIFKSEVDTMRTDDKKKDEPATPPASPPLSGRVVDDVDAARPPTTSSPESTSEERR